nr:uncharacterized protein LOC126544938 [Dermacentor andersoni]
MTSFMKQHFKWYGRICLVSGVAFVQISGTSKGPGSKTPLKSLYLLYSIFCFGLFATIQVFYIYQVSLEVFDNVQDFTRSLYVLLFIVLTLKIIVNVCCVAIKSRSLSDFFKSSTKYEIAVGFIAPKYCGQSTTCVTVRVLMSLAFIANVSASTYLSFEFVDYLMCNRTLDVFLKAVCFGGNFLFYVYEMVHFILLRPCAEVIRLYIRHQHDLLQPVVDGRCNAPLAKRSKDIEMIRMNLCSIVALKDQLNAIWGWCIMASGAVVLLVSCICIYSVFVEEFSTVQHLLTIMYSISSALDFVDIANLSQQMMNEMRKIRQTLQSAPTYFENGGYFNQICLLRESIKPKEMALSGAGFFTFHLPLVVSLSGAVITYTVILVQTSQSVKTT